MDEHVGGGRTTKLLVYLHGHASASEYVHSSFREHRDDGWCRVCPVGPLDADGGRAWFTTGPRGADAASLDAAVDLVTTVVRSAATELDLSLDDVVLGGFSQGAATALATAARLGDTLGGLLLQAGFVPEVVGDDIPLASIAARSVLVQHPDDDEVVPPSMGRDLAALLKDAGRASDVELELFDGGHRVSDEMADAALRWLARR